MRFYTYYAIGIFWLLLAACSGKPAGSQYQLALNDPRQPVLHWVPDEEQKQLIAQSQWNALASLFILQGGKPVSVPVGLTAYSRHDTFFMTPLMPLGSGLEFEWQIYRKSDTVRKKFNTIVKAGTRQEPVKVVSAFPQTDTIPSNILLFHLFFSAPMLEDEQAYRHVHVYNEAGQEIQFAWRQKASWADSGRQLILMVHPGRIKSGINYARESGPLFEPGKRYTLNVDDSLRPLREGAKVQVYNKTLYIRSADHSSPAFMPHDPQRSPAPNTMQPLHIAFNEAMDYGTASIGLIVQDQQGLELKGHFSAVNDKLWIFTPEKPWSAQTYQLSFNEYLADLASNHIDRLFEVKSMEGMQRHTGVAWTFRVQ